MNICFNICFERSHDGFLHIVDTVRATAQLIDADQRVIKVRKDCNTKELQQLIMERVANRIMIFPWQLQSNESFIAAPNNPKMTQASKGKG